MVGTEPGCPWQGGHGLAPSPTQAMNIREQIGYPDYILEEGNKHLDEEYSNVCVPMGPPSPPPGRGPSRAPPVPSPQSNLPLNQPRGPSFLNYQGWTPPNLVIWPCARAPVSPSVTSEETEARRVSDLAQ